MEQVK